MPSWAFLAISDEVWTTMPSAAGVVQEVVRMVPRGVSISTRHIRHIPTSFMRGCQQKRGM